MRVEAKVATMTFSVKMTMFLYILSLGIIANGFHGFQLPH
jgi:hypothetical protein